MRITLTPHPNPPNIVHMSDYMTEIQIDEYPEPFVPGPEDYEEPMVEAEGAD